MRQALLALLSPGDLVLTTAGKMYFRQGLPATHTSLGTISSSLSSTFMYLLIPVLYYFVCVCVCTPSAVLWRVSVGAALPSVGLRRLRRPGLLPAAAASAAAAGAAEPAAPGTGESPPVHLPEQTRPLNTHTHTHTH